VTRTEQIGEDLLQLCRAFASGTAPGTEFISAFLALFNDPDFRFAPTQEALNLSTWLGWVWNDVDNHNEFDDIREPGEFDDDQLRDAVREKLRLWDTGEYDPETMW
jgi:hypothetical protein